MGDSLADTNLPVGNNHIFLNVFPVVQQSPEYVEAVIKVLARRYADRLRRLRVSQVEFRVVLSINPQSPPIPIRLISSNPTGYVLRVDTYVEARDEAGGVPIFTSIAPGAFGVKRREGGSFIPTMGALSGISGGFLASLGLGSLAAPVDDASAKINAGVGASSSSSLVGRGDLDGHEVTWPYPVSSPFEAQRAGAAALSDTVYVYDFLELFSRALEIEWSAYEKSRRGGTGAAKKRPRTVLHAVELILSPKRTSGGVNSSGGKIGDAGEGGEATFEASTSPSPPPTSPSPPSASVPILRRSNSIFIDQYSNEMQLPPTAQALSASGRQTQSPVAGAPPQQPVKSMTPTQPSSNSSSSSIKSRSFRPEDYELVESDRPPGTNDIGMVAWRITMFTPQYGEESSGREIVVIANDITFRAGSFGTEEDRLFELASAYARNRGIPRIFLAANSGARIGLAEEIKKKFNVAWIDPAEPAKGYRYLYLTPSDYAQLCGIGLAGLDSGAGAQINSSAPSPPALPTSNQAMPSLPSVNPVLVRKEVTPSGEERYVITDVIGREPDLGVENLRGSGTIAGETSRAYSSSFTLTYVTGRTVGIGAYLVRLGHRCIQKTSSAPIILTGFEALNKLMGAEVYSSNQQLGGPRIMYTNGVAHEIVDNDFEGVLSVLRWLSYVPKIKGNPLPTMDCIPGDEADRDVLVEPLSTPFDPRILLTGSFAAPPPATPSALPNSQSWLPGLFDRNTFRECMGGWAKSVITGRARLGGLPIGVIIPELRTVTAVSPADPAAPTSQETISSQAGQVWFPDSAFKTAQALRDFAGEDLPVIIIANWRGFSGGQRDMFNEVLKFGSLIVDALVATSQPVFVYIPPRGELRGGAWVVVDPTINPDAMEMYSDPTGRGGVLEPSGIVSIKYRGKDLESTALRLDPALASLEAAAKAAASKDSPEAAAAAAKAVASRKEAISGVILQVAHSFADLHDTPGRMLAKGAIHGVVPWRHARRFFYWRLRRRLTEGSLARRMCVAASQLSNQHAKTLLKSWYLSSLAGEGVRVTEEAAEWKDDVRVLRWLADSSHVIAQRINALRRESISETVLSLGKEDYTAVVTGVLALLSRLPDPEREGALGALRRGLIFGDHGSSSPFRGVGMENAGSPHANLLSSETRLSGGPLTF